MSDNTNKDFNSSNTQPLRNTASKSPGPGQFVPASSIGASSIGASNNFNSANIGNTANFGRELGDSAEKPSNGIDLKSDIKTEAKDLGNQAKDAATQLASQTKALVESKVAKRSDRGVRDLAAVADALRKTGDQLQDNMVAPYIGKAADQINRVSDFIRTADPKQVVRQVERFARREPLIFLGGAFALGMLGARFIKSSSEGAAEGEQAEGSEGVRR